MTVGFVLINVAPGKEITIFETISNWNEVLDIYPLFGDYDIIAKIEAINYETLSDVIVHKIRPIEGIIDTKTLPTTKF